jgi:hypothetical protein
MSLMARYSDSSPATGYIGGKIASVVVWSRPLSASDVRAIARNDAFDVYNARALLALYPFEMGQGSNVVDLTHQQADGT